MQRGATRKPIRYDAQHSIVLQAQSWDVTQTPMSSQNWQGQDAKKLERQRIKAALERKSAELMMTLAKFVLVWYDDQ